MRVSTSEELLGAFSELRALFPDWRMGQLVANLVTAAGGTDAGAICDMEDAQLLTAARRLIERNRGRGALSPDEWRQHILETAGKWQGELERPEQGECEERESLSGELPTGTDKQIAFSALQRMPESATLDEISEELAILAALRRGQAATDAGRTLTHEEVKQRSGTWIGK